MQSTWRKVFSRFIQYEDEGNTVQKLTLGQEQNYHFKRLTVDGVTGTTRFANPSRIKILSVHIAN